MYTELMIVGGIFWSLTYILVIRHGFKDKTYGIPLGALCANISWEAIFSFIHPHSPPQLYINYIWFFLDVIIILQFLKYGKSEFPKFSIRQFYFTFLMALTTAFFLVLFITYEFNDFKGAYTAFGQNLMMSILFITMLLSRNDLRGQSIYIALFKMLGTGISSLAFYLYQPISQGSFLLPFLFVSIFVYDLIYLVIIYQKYRIH
ncbi:MAG: hypothetical protein J5U17_00515 [Candidatus Methanoperedens sp.]|nr:hypothetical protein [Candidatus Methanoperedens sp.]MCE8429577.1 hypothetical protein [Candidatus Methanoperedens sp.]